MLLDYNSVLDSVRLDRPVHRSEGEKIWENIATF